MTMMLMVPMSVYALNVDVENDVTVSANGVTFAVDQDGDKITGKFICIGTLPSCDWEQRVDVSGTRKYEGIKPQNKFEFTFVDTTGHGVSLVHDGTYNYPAT